MQENLKQTGVHNDFICELHGAKFVTGYSHSCQYWCEKCLELEQEKERKMELRFKAFRALGLEKRQKLCTFSTYIPKTNNARTAFEACQEFSKDWKNLGGLIMLGGIGTGKTHLAISICQALSEQGVICHYTTISKVVRRIKNSWKNRKTIECDNRETEEDIIKNYARYSLLVFDEVGSQYGSDTDKIFVSEIINDRYNKMLPTIIIGNVTFSEIQESIGKRAVDRICDNGQVLIFDWESYRKEKKR